MQGFGRRTQIAQSPRVAAIAASASEQRFAPRRGSATPAFVFVEGGVESIPCVIRDMSTTGARLELKDGWDNPFKSRHSEMDRVKLVIRQDRVMYECKIIRRAETEIGVKFTSAPKAITKITR
jgi:hypothetical protein